MATSESLQKAAQAWQTKKNENKILDADLTEAFADILDEIKNKKTIKSPLIHSEFIVHILNDIGIEKAKLVANLFNKLLDDLYDLEIFTKNSREVSLVRTKLEEACFFAKKAMANENINLKDPIRISQA